MGAVMEPPPEATTRLIARARHDAQALDQLLRVQMEFLRHHAEQALGGRRSQHAGTEDLVQDVLERVHRSIAHAEFADERAFRSWLLVLIKNRALDLARKHARSRQHGSMRSLDDTVANASAGHIRMADLVPGAVRTPSSIVGKREQVDSMWKVLERIPESYREIIRLIRIEGLSTDEAAARLGKTPANVRKTLSRAIQSCRTAMGLTDPPKRP